MDVSKYQFDEDEIVKLDDRRDNQPDARLKIRFIALLMIAKGVELQTIASIIGKSIKPIENWHYQYVTKGIDSLNSFQYKPKQSYLTSEQIDQVVSWTKEANPGKTKEVREYIKDHFKVAYSVEAVRKVLKKTDLRFYDQKLYLAIRPSKRSKKKHRKIFRNETYQRTRNCVSFWRWHAFDPSECSGVVLGRSQKSTSVKNQYRPSATQYIGSL
jgi:transposase